MNILVALSLIISLSGMPSAIIKDYDSTLDKGVRLFSQKYHVVIPVIDDIGHVMATALKHQFEKKVQYKRLYNAQFHTKVRYCLLPSVS